MKADAVVFGLYETGLGVARSLGLEGISVIGIDHKKDLGFYSRYIKPYKCPHPIFEEDMFLSWIDNKFSSLNSKLPVFISSDDFLIAFSKNRDILSRYFLFNLPDTDTLEKISDKFRQYELAVQSGIHVPKTFVVNEVEDIYDIPEDVLYPLFIKGKDVNSWRKNISGNIKGFKVENQSELYKKAESILLKKVPIIIQELIIGNDLQHFKYCAYVSKSGKLLSEFTLQKIRQSPPHFGVGSVVISNKYPLLIKEGRKLFQNIGYRGIGSAEFKLDERDNILKLIEINPRYWQQNYLSTYCGINFPLINFNDLNSVESKMSTDYQTNVKWINRQLDFDSFLKYRKEKRLNYKQWRHSREGHRIYSDFLWKDPIPALYNIEFGWMLIKAPFKILKRISKEL